MSTKPNPKLKDLRASQKRLHQEEVDAIVQSTYAGAGRFSQTVAYNAAKKMRWWSYLTAVALAVGGTGLAFLVGFLTRHSEKMPDYQGAGWTTLIVGILLVVAYMMISFIKNREAAKYFNDRRRRYQRTMTTWEAKIILWKKTLALALLLLLPALICTNVLFH